MNRLLHSLLIAGLSMIFSVTSLTASAQRDHSRGRQSHHSSVAPSRPGNHGSSISRPSGGTRPSGFSRPSGNSRPGGSGRPEGTRPGNNRPGGNDRPGGNNPGHGNAFGHEHNRPGGNDRPNGHNPGHNPGGSNPGHNPGHNPGYGHGFGPGNRPTPPPPPGAHYGWQNVHHGHPHRPMCPPPTPFRRPVPPPPHYAYYPGFRPFQTILGVALGTALNLSIDALLNNGYNVTAYDNNVVYLTNVSQLSYNWPDATLYYNNGSLSASEFFYSTSYDNIDRYDNLFYRLQSAYGNPYNVVPYGASGAMATWWGPNGQFITIKYAPQYTSSGALRYFTTLSYGV